MKKQRSKEKAIEANGIPVYTVCEEWINSGCSDYKVVYVGTCRCEAPPDMGASDKHILICGRCGKVVEDCSDMDVLKSLQPEMTLEYVSKLKDLVYQFRHAPYGDSANRAWEKIEHFVSPQPEITEEDIIVASDQYTRDKHDSEYYDPAYRRDRIESEIDFKAGIEWAQKQSTNKSKK